MGERCLPLPGTGNQQGGEHDGGQGKEESGDGGLTSSEGNGGDDVEEQRIDEEERAKVHEPVVPVVAVALVASACTRDEQPASAGTSTSTPPGSASPPTTSPAPAMLGTVHIANDVFGWADPGMTSSNESIVVRGAGRTDDLVQALGRIGARFMHVDETGVEHGSEELEPLGGDIFIAAAK